MCEDCSKLTIKTAERHQWRRSSSVFIVNFEQISHIVLVFPTLTLNKYRPDGKALELDLYQVFAHKVDFVWFHAINHQIYLELTKGTRIASITLSLSAFAINFEKTWTYCSGVLYYLFRACFPAGIYLLKVNNTNARTRSKIYPKLTL